MLQHSSTFLQCHARWQQPVPSPDSLPIISLQLLSPELMSRKETFKLKKTDIVQQFQRFPGDVGSCEIQGM